MGLQHCSCKQPTKLRLLILETHDTRRSIAQQGAFPPDAESTIRRLWAYAIGEHIRRLLPRRRPRANLRVVKRKYTEWHVKRSHHHNWPQPNRLPEQAMVI